MRQPGDITILAGADLEAYRRVRNNGTNWVYCGATEDAEAVTATRIASGTRGAAWSVTEDGVVPIINTGGGVTLGCELFGGANGQCSATNGGVFLGTAFQLNAGGGADGDPIDVVLRQSQKTMAINQSAVDAVQITANQSGQCFTNAGAAGALTIKLPAAKKGLRFSFGVDAAQSYTVQTFAASGDKVCLPDTGVPGAANKGLVNAGTANVYLKLECFKDGIWSFAGGNAKVGIWTAEP